MSTEKFEEARKQMEEKLTAGRGERSAAVEAALEALRRRMNPTWKDLVLGYLAAAVATIAQAALMGIGFHLGWSLIR